MTALDTFLSVWRVRRIDLRSPLSPGECIGRIRDATEGLSLFPGMSDRPFKGHVIGSRAWLTKRRLLQNSWAAMAACKVTDDGLKSRVQVRIGVAFSVRAFTVFAIGFIVLWLTLAILHMALQSASYAWVMPIAGLAFFALFFGMTVWGRSLASGDEAFLETTLTELLEATA